MARGGGRWLVLLAWILAGCGTARLPRAARGPEGAWRSFANGLRLYVAPDSSGDLVQVHMRVRAGSRNEARAQAGLAHFSEHLAFARTLADGRTLLAAMGEEALLYSGTTDADFVDFTARTVAAHLPTVLGLFASALDGSCEVSPEVFTRERNVVLSEIEFRMRGSTGVLNDLVAGVYSPEHPYGHLIGGTPDTVSALTVADACDYLRGRFTPGNASVVITGGVTEAAALAAAETTLQRVASRPSLPEVVVPPVAGVGGRDTLVGLPGGWGMALVLHLPPAGSKDGRFAEILVELVEAEVRRLLEWEPGSPKFEVGPIGGQAAPSVVFAITGATIDAREFAERVLDEAIRNVRKDVADKKVVEPLRGRQRLAAATRYERLDARAERLVEVADGSRLGALASDLRALDRLTPAALTRVAEQVLARERVGKFELAPGRTQAGTGLAAVARLADDDQPVTARPDVAARLLAEIPASRRSTRYTLENGLTVVLAPSSSPMVDVRLMIAAGIVDAPREHPLLAPMAMALLKPPEKGPHAKAMARLRAGGAELDGSFNLDVSVFKTRGLASETDHLLRGLAAVAVAGEYDFKERRAALERVRDGVDEMRRAESVRRQIARQRLDTCDELVGDPYEPDQFDDAAIVAFREQHFRAGRATLVVAGGFDEAVAREHVKAAFGGRQAPWGAAAEAPSRASRPAPNVNPAVVRVDPGGGGRQIGVLLGFVVPSELRRDSGTLALVRQLLEDAAEDVRERLGVSYGFWVTREDLCDAEMILIGGDIDAAHLDQGIAELRQALARLRTPEGVARVLAAAQRPVAARLLAQASDSSAIADRLTFLAGHGLPPDFYRNEAREVVEATADAIAGLLARVLAPERLFKVCVGPQERTAACETLSSP
ncbi:M16 family metallopeptidase [Nannocystis punicea]|uniref:Insulinase family protein n=1 Tax=Nannocystis punicea TaxID=2995304 RepID=A0ABY7H915_9BACT|nr:insulinase family protein [Nannocystis poenicansa]WAS95597.1 insulinase family protein [Nannocystis poenicansa]